MIDNNDIQQIQVGGGVYIAILVAESMNVIFRQP